MSATKSPKKPSTKKPKKPMCVATHITMILDRSGSMERIKTDVIGAVNHFIEEQQKVDGECSFTLVQFDSENSYEVIYDGDIQKSTKLDITNYVPRAWTPLYDAIGRGIADVAKKDLKDKKVVFVVETDGEENHSREHNKDSVKKLIDSHKEWHFLFLGANIDAMGVAAGIGGNTNTAANYSHTGKGTMNANRITSSNIAAFRATGQSANLCYTDDQRVAMMADDKDTK